MSMITCKRCGTQNGYKSRFCEKCGKKMKGTNQSDGVFIFVFLLVVIGGGIFAYSQGYRLTDLQTLIASFTKKA